MHLWYPWKWSVSLVCIVSVLWNIWKHNVSYTHAWHTGDAVARRPLHSTPVVSIWLCAMLHARGVCKWYKVPRKLCSDCIISSFLAQVHAFHLNSINGESRKMKNENSYNKCFEDHNVWKLHFIMKLMEKKRKKSASTFSPCWLSCLYLHRAKLLLNSVWIHNIRSSP